MSGRPTWRRLSIDWSDPAKAQVRAIDRLTALNILHCTDRYLEKHEGDVKKLQPPLTGLRLRCGDYRIFFDPAGEHAIRVTSVLHRREAYR